MGVRLVRIERSGGRWTVLDPELGYRICNNYQHAKYPSAPSHVHDRFDAVIGPCAARDAEHAFRAMRAYRRRQTALDLARLDEEIEAHGDPDEAD